MLDKEQLADTAARPLEERWYLVSGTQMAGWMGLAFMLALMWAGAALFGIALRDGLLPEPANVFLYLIWVFLPVLLPFTVLALIAVKARPKITQWFDEREATQINVPEESPHREDR